MKRFASIWFPRFRIDRLQRAQAKQVPLDKPFALVESGARGIIIVAVNRIAQAKGIRVGQALSDARAILPDLMTRPGEAARDDAALNRLALWLGRYGPCRNREGDDGLWVDITGVAHLFGDEAGLAKDCFDRLARAGFRVRCGIGDTRSGAFALARYGCGPGRCITISRPGEMRDALRGLPVEGLQIQEDLIVLLRRLGLRRIGQLYDLPRAALTRRFREGAGKSARSPRSKPTSQRATGTRPSGWAQSLVMRLDQALGMLGEPTISLVEVPVFRVQRSFAEPLISHAGIEAGLDTLARDLCVLLADRVMGARRYQFQVYRADGGVARLDVRVSRPVNAPDHIAGLFAPRLGRLDAGLGIDALVLEAFDCEMVADEQTGLGDCGPGGIGRGGAERLGALADRLVNRLGRRAVYHLAPIERHIPELAQVRRSVLEEEVHEKDDVRRPTTSRPLFLIDPAERIEVIADVPDGPPARFTWRRIMRRVVRAEGPERIAPEWWTRLEERPENMNEEAVQAGTVAVCRPGRRVRDYYRIEDVHGAQYWVYRAGLYGDEGGVAADGGVTGFAERDVSREPPQWFLQGMF
jgi:protein ImuB